MRLINTATLALGEEVFGDDIPRYAILSHTWTKEEVTLREWQGPTTATRAKAGYVKVRDACGVARGLGHEFLWADTVCIDKTSSAELSEAINSMYAWYRDSAVCLVYLEDVERVADDEKKQWLERFTASRWFTRGWTLQELLAPSELTFYDRNWKPLGCKRELADPITLATGIARCHIEPASAMEPNAVFPPEAPSIATRMSWMARRRTTRVEDMAYCMLGIFDINMPLLYGEGPKAFLRLQHEILRTYHDHTIFAWTWPPAAETDALDFGVLAPSPAAFSGLRDLRQINDAKFGSRTPYTITNLGLSIRLPRLYTADSMQLAILQCIDEHHESKQHLLAIKLKSGDDAWTVSRARDPPKWSLRYCRELPAPPLRDLFLRIQPSGSRHHDAEVGLTRIGATPSSPTTPNRYGLFLTLSADNAVPYASSHPSSCLDRGRSLLQFPSNPSHWREIIAPCIRSAPPLASNWYSRRCDRVRTTAAVLCVTDRRNVDAGFCRRQPFFSVLFTVSEVTMTALRGRHSTETRTLTCFGQGVGIPNDWHHATRADQVDKNWQDWNPRLGIIVEEEVRRIISKLETTAVEDMVLSEPRRPLQSDESKLVDVGCCDVEYPGFKEVRVAWINCGL